MMALYFVGIIYFVGRILFFRIGWLRDCVHSKRMGYKHRKLKPFRVHATALNIDKRLQDQAISFDADSSSIVCDNSANVHVCNNKSMFVGAIRRCNKHFVATIGGNKNVAAGTGTVCWK